MMQLIPFCLYWNLFVITFHAVLVAAMAATGYYLICFVLLFLLPFDLIGVFIPYALIACLLNSMRILVGSDQLTIWIEPVPWRRERILHVEDIKEICVNARRIPGIQWCEVDAMLVDYFDAALEAAMSGSPTCQVTAYLSDD